MTTRIVLNGLGKETGNINYISNGKLLAEYCAPIEEYTVTINRGALKGRTRTCPGRPAALYFNSKCLMCGKEWWGKSWLERAKPEYKDDIKELLEKYPDINKSEFISA